MKAIKQWKQSGDHFLMKWILLRIENKKFNFDLNDFILNVFRELKIPENFFWSGCHFNVGKLLITVFLGFELFTRLKNFKAIQTCSTLAHHQGLGFGCKWFLKKTKISFSFFFSSACSMFVWRNLMNAWWNIKFGKVLCPPREATHIVLFCNEQMGTCHWMGLQFHNWIDYNYRGCLFKSVTRMGSNILGILRVRKFW